MRFLALLLIGVVAAGCTSDSREASEKTPPSISFGELPSVVVEQGGFMWALDRRGGGVAKIDPETNQVVDTFELGDGTDSKPRDDVWDLAATDSALWVTAPAARSLLKIDPETGAIDRVNVGSFVSDVYGAAGSLWARRRDHVARLDAATGRVVAEIPFPGDQRQISDVVEHAGVVWLVTSNAQYIAGGGPNPTYKVSAELWRISPSTNEVQSRLDLGSTFTRGAVNPVIGDVEVVDEGLWMSRVAERRLVLVDPTDGEVLLQFVLGIFEHPWEFAVVGDHLWVGELNGDEVAHIDPETRERTLFDLGEDDLGVSYVGGGFGSLWVPLGGAPPEGGRIVRLDPPND